MIMTFYATTQYGTKSPHLMLAPVANLLLNVSGSGNTPVNTPGIQNGVPWNLRVCKKQNTP